MEPVCYIRFLHAVPDIAGIDIYINHTLSAKNISYQEFTEYSAGKPGIYTVQIFPAGRKDLPLIDAVIELIGYTIYTLAAIGRLDNIEVELIPDLKKPIDKSSTYVRFIVLSPLNTHFNVSLNNAIVETGLIYKEVSKYSIMDPGNYYFRALDQMTDELLLESPNMFLKAGKKYSVYIIGVNNVNPGLQILVPLEGSTYLT